MMMALAALLTSAQNVSAGVRVRSRRDLRRSLYSTYSMNRSSTSKCPGRQDSYRVSGVYVNDSAVNALVQTRAAVRQASVRRPEEVYDVETYRLLGEDESDEIRNGSQRESTTKTEIIPCPRWSQPSSTY